MTKVEATEKINRVLHELERGRLSADEAYQCIRRNTLDFYAGLDTVTVMRKIIRAHNTMMKIAGLK